MAAGRVGENVLDPFQATTSPVTYAPVVIDLEA
jgi:hypothetical protein